MPIEIPITVPEQRPRRAEQDPLFRVRVGQRCGRAAIFEDVRLRARVFGGDGLPGFGNSHLVDGVHVQRQQRCVRVEVGGLEHGAEEGETAWCVEVGFVGDVGGLGRGAVVSQ